MCGMFTNMYAISLLLYLVAESNYTILRFRVKFNKAFLINRKYYYQRVHKILWNINSFSFTVSSSRVGGWQKDVRSGIPVPVSSDTRMRFRTNRTYEPTKGPVSAPHYT